MGWLIFTIGIIWIFSLLFKKNTAEKEQTSKINLFKNETEEEKIYRIAEEKKERAKELGIVDDILELFFYGGSSSFNVLKFKDSSLVSNLTQDSKDTVIRRCLFNLNNKNFECTYNSKEALFDLFVEGKKSLSLKMNYETKIYQDKDVGVIDCQNWWCSDIQGFIEGEWVQDLKRVIKQNSIDAQVKAKKEKESPEKIKNLKDSFGIE